MQAQLEPQLLKTKAYLKMRKKIQHLNDAWSSTKYNLLVYYDVSWKNFVVVKLLDKKSPWHQVESWNIIQITKKDL